MRQNRISINDIKWDLIRIIEPYDGILENKKQSEDTMKHLFQTYLDDLVKVRTVSYTHLTLPTKRIV